MLFVFIYSYWCPTRFSYQIRSFVVCLTVHLLFTLFVFACVKWCQFCVLVIVVSLFCLLYYMCHYSTYTYWIPLLASSNFFNVLIFQGRDCFFFLCKVISQFKTTHTLCNWIYLVTGSFNPITFTTENMFSMS